MKSLMTLPKTHIAGESPVSRSGVFRYCKIARWNLSVFSEPLGPVFSMISRFIVLTAISARQLLCGNATEEMRWCTPQFLRNVSVAVAVYSGPPSEVSSSLMPKVMNVLHSVVINPSAPLAPRSTIGQLLYLSTAIR